MARHREPPPRLNIPQSLNVQQPMAFDRGQPTYSPALPTSLQHSLHPPFPVHNSMQTPTQSYFPSKQQQQPPGRPTHRQAQASIAQLAAAGIMPPTGFSMSSTGGHFSRPSLMIGPAPPFISQHGGGPPFPHRNRRQPSIGGPPKAVLGGPAKKYAPSQPPTLDASSAPTPKSKKITVNLPKETIPGIDGEQGTRPSWARNPLDASFIYKEQEVASAELTTAELFPSDSWRLRVPGAIDVFLPGKVWILYLLLHNCLFTDPSHCRTRHLTASLGQNKTTSYGGETPGTGSRAGLGKHRTSYTRPACSSSLSTPNSC
jgi:hypothetical protein